MLNIYFLRRLFALRMAVLSVLGVAMSLVAVPACATEEAAVSQPAAAVPTNPKALIASMYGGVTADDLQETPVPGLYEMLLDGSVFYVSANGEYLLAGTMYKIDGNGQTDLTEPRRQEVRRNLINNAGEDTMIVFEPEGEVKHTITVFTDTSCHYCRELHKVMAGYTERGIRVRYMAYPRRGPQSQDGQLMQSVWCADDRQAAMTAAKLRQPVAPAKCNAPIQRHYMIGRQVGVSGTPAIVTESGELIPGFRPPEQMIAALNK